MKKNLTILQLNIIIGSSFFFPVKVNMRHRFVTHSFMLLPIPDPSAEQAQPPVFSVSGTKREALSALLLFSESSLGHANAQTHQSGRGGKKIYWLPEKYGLGTIIRKKQGYQSVA